jgi:hypothetical protein
MPVPGNSPDPLLQPYAAVANPKSAQQRLPDVSTVAQPELAD